MTDVLNGIKQAAHKLMRDTLRTAGPSSPACIELPLEQAPAMPVVETTELPIKSPKNKERILPSVVLQVSENYPNIDPNLIAMLVEDIWAYGYVSQDDNDGRVLSVDFDGTIAEWAEFPRIGMPIPGAVDALRKLTDEGWKVIVFSHRATLPGGREQIAAWLREAGVNVGAVIPKVYARWYLDDRAIPFNNNWDDVYAKLHYDTPVAVSGPAITSTEILAGKHSLRTIAEALGHDHTEMHTDLNSAFGNHTVKEAYVIEGMLSNKYGLNLSLKAMSQAENPSIYLMRKLAGLVDKLAKNHIEEGDPVVIVQAGPNFGDSGVVLNLSDDKGALVALDGATCSTLHFKDTAALRLAAGHSRLDPLKLESSAVRPAAEWYAVAAEHIVKQAAGLPAIVTYAGPAGLELTQSETELTLAKINSSRLVSVDTDLSAATTVAALHLAPNTGVSANYTKLVVADLVDSFLGYPHLSDVSVRFSGTNGYYMLLKFDKPMERERLKAALTASINLYAEETNMSKVSTAPTAEADVLVVTPCIQLVPAAYSVHKHSGLVCIPLDLNSLADFSPEKATISSLMGTGTNGTEIGH